MSKPNHIYSGLRQRLAFIYALLIGVAGVLLLVWLLEYQTMSFDLLALLPFAVLAIVVSYLRIPFGQEHAELSIEGVVLLGAMLGGGPVIGGWVAFITGLVVSILPQPRPSNSKLDWVEQTALAALNGGRNVIAIGAAWLTFYWSGGMHSPASITPSMALTLLLMCLVFALTRLFLIWLLTLFSSSQPLQSFFQVTSISQLLIELLPLPAALTFSPLFMRFAWVRFLIMSLILVGCGALLRFMAGKIQAAEEQNETLRLHQRVERAFSKLPSSIPTLCNLVHQFCHEIAPSRCETGVFNAAMTQVYVQVSTEKNIPLPPMHIPMTAFWSWIGDLQQAQIVPAQVAPEALPFPLPRLEGGITAQTALLLPIHDKKAATDDLPSPPPLGGIILLSETANAFDRITVERLNLLADLAETAIRRLRASPFEAMETSQEPLVRYIQQSLLPDDLPDFRGWRLGCAAAPSPLSNGVWFDCQPAQAGWSFCLTEPSPPGLRGALLSTIVRALVGTLSPQENTAPAQLVHELNERLLAFNQQTAYLYVINEQENLLSWANAGCPPVLWWHQTQGRVEVMQSTAPLLGAGPDLDIETISVALGPGDAIIVYTRGLIEARYEGEAFQTNRLSEAIRRHAHLPADELAQALIDQMREFVHQSPLEQDAFVIVFQADG